MESPNAEIGPSKTSLAPCSSTPASETNFGGKPSTTPTLSLTLLPANQPPDPPLTKSSSTQSHPSRTSTCSDARRSPSSKALTSTNSTPGPRTPSTSDQARNQDTACGIQTPKPSSSVVKFTFSKTKPEYPRRTLRSPICISPTGGLIRRQIPHPRRNPFPPARERTAQKTKRKQKRHPAKKTRPEYP